MHESNLLKTKTENKVKEREIIEITLGPKTGFDYRETRPSENGQQDGYRRVELMKTKIKIIKSSHISKSDFAPKFQRESRNSLKRSTMIMQ
jgi:hypothetical protein